jgi:hypothetical protein
MGQSRTLALALLLAGCQAELDMAKVYDAERPATTIPYAGIRPDRQYGDYSTIHASILRGAATSRP